MAVCRCAVRVFRGGMRGVNAGVTTRKSFRFGVEGEGWHRRDRNVIAVIGRAKNSSVTLCLIDHRRSNAHRRGCMGMNGDERVPGEMQDRVIDRVIGESGDPGFARTGRVRELWSQ